MGNALQADWEWMYTDGCYPYVGNAGCTSESPDDPPAGTTATPFSATTAPPRRQRRRRGHGHLGTVSGLPHVDGGVRRVHRRRPERGHGLPQLVGHVPGERAAHLVRLSPSTGGVGSHITIQGVYLTGASAVEFDGSGCTAAPAVTSDESAGVVIPPACREP